MHECYIKKRSERRTPEKKKENGGSKNKRRRGGRRKLFYCHHAHLSGKVSRVARISRTRSIQVLLLRKICHSMRNILLSSILLQFLLLFLCFFVFFLLFNRTQLLCELCTSEGVLHLSACWMQDHKSFRQAVDV